MAFIETSVPTIQAPTLDSSLFEGQIDSVLTTVGSTVNTIIDTIVTPANAAIKLVEGMMNTAEDTYNVANTAYQTALLLTPGDSAKLKQSMERAQAFQQKLESIYKKLNSAMDSVQQWTDEAKDIINTGIKHSKEWIQEQLNSILQKIQTRIDKIVDWVNQKIEQTQEKLQKKIDEAEEKAKKKIEEAAVTKTEEFIKQQKKNKLAQANRQLKLTSMMC